jgi:hypothetical protein
VPAGRRGASTKAGHIVETPKEQRDGDNLRKPHRRMTGDERPPGQRWPPQRRKA